jgi:hypothetical protein
MIRRSRASRAENPETKTVKWKQLRLSLAPLVSSCFMHLEMIKDYLNKTKQGHFVGEKEARHHVFKMQ